MTMDRARALFAMVIEDWPVMSGDPASPTEHLTFWDKMDSVSSGHTPEYSAGSDTVTVGGTPTLEDGSKGDGTLFDADTESFSFPVADHITKESGTISFDYVPNESGTPSAHRYLFNNNIRFRMYRSSSNSSTYFEWDNIVIITVLSFVADQLTHIAFAWDIDTDDVLHQWIMQDGVIVKTGSSAKGTYTLATTFYLGGDNSSNNANGIIDNFKIYDTPILPYGTLIPANIISGDVDYDMAHDDITLYSNASGLDIGTTSVTTISNVSNSEGTIAFQVDPPSALSADETLFSAGTNFHIKWDDSDDDILFTYGSATVRTTTSLTAGLDGKHWIVARYEASGNISIEADGLVDSAAASTAPTLGAEIAWSSNVGMTKRTITNKEGTPQLFTANLAPLILPDFKSEVA